MKFKVLILSMTFSFSNFAGKVLASKSGPFEKFNYCSIEKERGHISLTGPSGLQMSEETEIEPSSLFSKSLSKAAIEGAGRTTYRWSVTQTDYFIFGYEGDEGDLVRFYANGFQNVENKSQASAQLITEIDHFCDDILNDFKILGDFAIELHIGNDVLLDSLSIKRNHDLFIGTTIKGIYSVPNSFQSRIENLNYINGKFIFVITVKEAGQEYKASFEGSFQSDNEITGNAFILPNKKFLGTFKGARI